jgi:hypothetical protein
LPKKDFALCIMTNIAGDGAGKAMQETRDLLVAAIRAGRFERRVEAVEPEVESQRRRAPARPRNRSHPGIDGFR